MVIRVSSRASAWPWQHYLPFWRRGREVRETEMNRPDTTTRQTVNLERLQQTRLTGQGLGGIDWFRVDSLAVDSGFCCLVQAQG